jgi:hypothetical protein
MQDAVPMSTFVPPARLHHASRLTRIFRSVGFERADLRHGLDNVVGQHRARVFDLQNPAREPVLSKNLVEQLDQMPFELQA